MPDRVDKAYDALDNALQELVNAIDEEDGWADAGTVTDYVIVIGQQRFTGRGRGRDGEPYMLLPFGSQAEYVTNGLLSKVPELLADTYPQVVFEFEDGDAE
ncbi:hypothetical protein [Rhodococcus jostii]|uniref:DUF7213 family protein n=1 Tax=Rhodococcus jostii TaxID=132919 RepID=UPI003645A0B5